MSYISSISPTSVLTVKAERYPNSDLYVVTLYTGGEYDEGREIFGRYDDWKMANCAALDVHAYLSRVFPEGMISVSVIEKED